MASTTFLQKAYLAYFGRPADASGLITFANVSEAQVIASFSASPESQEFFGSMPLLEQINTIYNNLFNRDAEPAGLLHWATKIQSGELTLAAAAMVILSNAQNSDVTAVANKLAASAAFTAAVDTTPEILGYAGADAIAPARAFLASVTSDPATLTAATKAAALDASVAGVVDAGTHGANAGQTFMLTTGLDSLTGTDGDDVFVGGVDVAGSTVNTLSALDAVNGGAGKDTLKIGFAAGTIALPSLTSVEVIEVQGADDVTVASTPADVTNLNVTQAKNVDVTGGATTAVAVSGATGAKIEVKGGSDVAVTSATKDQAVTVGGIKGAVTVTATKEAGAIAIDGATDVTVVSTVANIDAAAIDIGKVTPVTGAVVVTQNLNSDGVAAQKGGPSPPQAAPP